VIVGDSVTRIAVLVVVVEFWMVGAEGGVIVIVAEFDAT
jgi:hypothetical protein